MGLQSFAPLVRCEPHHARRQQPGRVSTSVYLDKSMRNGKTTLKSASLVARRISDWTKSVRPASGRFSNKQIREKNNGIRRYFAAGFPSFFPTKQERTRYRRCVL